MLNPELYTETPHMAVDLCLGARREGNIARVSCSAILAYVVLGRTGKK